jgi:hypothetical protein
MTKVTGMAQGASHWVWEGVVARATGTQAFLIPLS